MGCGPQLLQGQKGSPAHSWLKLTDISHQAECVNREFTRKIANRVAASSDFCRRMVVVHHLEGRGEDGTEELDCYHSGLMFELLRFLDNTMVSFA